MAQRRMLNINIIDSDAFIGMPATTQNLYFHLCMRADDDGFISGPRKVQRMIGASDDDMRILLAKRFLLQFDSGVVVVKHWRIHNYIQKDRYHETLYKEERDTLYLKKDGAYTDHPVEDEPEPFTFRKGRTKKLKSAAVPSLPEKTEDGNGKTSASDLETVVEHWNALGLTKVTKLVPETERFIQLKKRLRDYGLEAVLKAIDNVKGSRYLRGANNRGWEITFDWLMKPNNFPKVLDGNYNDRETPEPDAEAMRAAKWLVKRIRGHTAEYRDPSPEELKTWALDIQSVFQQGYSWKEISDAMLFAEEDPFWQGVIFSGADVKKNFPKLLAGKDRSND